MYVDNTILIENVENIIKVHDLFFKVFLPIQQGNRKLLMNVVERELNYIEGPQSL